MLKKTFKTSREILRFYDGNIYRLYGLYVVAGLFDLIGIGMIVTFISLLQSDSSIYTTTYWIQFEHSFGIENNDRGIIIVGAAIVCIYLIKNLVAYHVKKNIVKLSWDLMVDLRGELLDRLQHMDYQEQSQQQSSHLITVIQTHVAQFAKGIVAATLRFLGESTIFLAFYLVLLLNFPTAVTAVTAILMTLVIFYDRVIKSSLVEFGQRVAKATAKQVEGIQTVVGSFKEIRVLGKQKYFHREVNRSFTDVADASVKVNSIQLLPNHVFEFLLVFLIVGTAVLALWQGADRAELLLMLSVFAMASIRMLPAFLEMITALSNIRYSSQFVFALHEELTRDTAKALQSVSFGGEALDFQHINVKGLSFKYFDRDDYVISKADFEVMRGDVVGITGSSGSGKSTLVNIMLGLLEPNNGGVYVNGISIFDNLDGWYQCAAYIPQKVRLVNESIRYNVAFGVSEEDIDDAKLLKALEQAELLTDVERLPEGVGTMIGENGQLLSGGQQQRVALARAFYFDRQVIILDEATSALDEETEQKIFKTIKSKHAEKTFFIITHRPAVLKECDLELSVCERSVLAHRYLRR